MAFERPTLSTLVARVKGDIQTRLDGADAFLRRCFEYAISVAAAGLAHELHGHLLWLSRQVIPDTAEEEFMARWAAVFGVDRKAASAAAGPLVCTGRGVIVIPAGTEWQRSDGAVFSSDADGTLESGTVTVDVTASEAGSDGNTDAGTTLQIASPIAGVDAGATVGTGGIADGFDAETDAELLARLLQRLRNPPLGGGPGDYERWALEVSGVTRAWELPLYVGPGTVGVFFVVDNHPTSIIPDATKVQEVQDYIDARRAPTAKIYVFAPTAVAYDVTLSVTPDTSAIRAAVTAQIEDWILRKAEPAGTLYWSQLNEAISLAADEEDHVVSAPTGNVTHAAGEIPVPGTVSFT